MGTADGVSGEGPLRRGEEKAGKAEGKRAAELWRKSVLKMLSKCLFPSESTGTPRRDQLHAFCSSVGEMRH